MSTGRFARTKAWFTRRRWREMSLRSRLTALAVAAVAFAVIGVSISSWLLVRAKLYQDFDSQLRTYSQLAAQAASPADAMATLRSADRRDTGRSTALTVQFLDRTGKPAGAAGDLPSVPASDLARQVASGRSANLAETIFIGHDRYRVWTVQRPGGAAQVTRDVEGVEDTLAGLGLWLGVVGVVGMAVAALIGRAVARAALRPVDVLTASAEEIARTQDLTAAIPVKGKDEIARLADAFNAMLAALAESRDAQRRLVQDAGHELRTPLTSLRTNVELLIHAGAQTDPAKVLSTEDRARLLNDLDVQTLELSTLVGELVDLSKDDRSPEALERFELADVVTAAVERARPRALHVSFELEVNGTNGAHGTEVLGRPASVERAVLNLLDNAAKWSPPEGRVGVTVVTEHTEPPIARITVTDEGPGIGDVDLPHVFERFYRADTARALPGSGLGLAIVEQIVTAHGGTASAARNGSGGAHISITIPLAPGVS